MNTLIKETLDPGDVIARWTVIEDTGSRQSGSRLLFCRCVCGREKAVRERNILNGMSRSCGCLSVDVSKSKKGVPKRRKNRVGDKIGEFTIVGIRFPVLSKEAGYFGECDNGHRVILTRNFINHPKRATCWCHEENTIRKYRRKKGLTVQQIADIICYSRTSVQITETKPQHSTEPILLAVGQLLEVPEDELQQYIQKHRSTKGEAVYG